MGYQVDVLRGVAQWLEDEGLGTWSETGQYQPTDTGIVVRTLPQSPDRVIVLATYPVSDDPSLSDTVTGLQVTVRWGGADPRPTDDLSDDVFDVVHGAHDVTLSTGIYLVQALHQSGSSLGQDDGNRWRAVANYYLTTHRPSPNRT